MQSREVAQLSAASAGIATVALQPVGIRRLLKSVASHFFLMALLLLDVLVLQRFDCHRVSLQGMARLIRHSVADSI